jgi:hypothetical protein
MKQPFSENKVVFKDRCLDYEEKMMGWVSSALLASLAMAALPQPRPDPATNPAYDPPVYDPTIYDPTAYDPTAYDPTAYDPSSYITDTGWALDICMKSP